MKYKPQQKIKVIHNCEVIGFRLKAGMTGTIYQVSDSLGEVLYRVKFDNDVSLPMREHEIQLVE